MPFQPSYRFMTIAYQIADGDTKKVFGILKKNSQLPENMANVDFENLDEEDLKNLEMRMNHVKNWLGTYAPEFVKFSVMKKIPKLPLDEDQIEFLLKLADLLEEKEYTAEELHDEMYDLLTELDMKPQKAFQAIYKIIIGKKQGPRAASFVLSLDNEFVVKRFRREA
jgi:lysyl-tRNA synthetase class 1